jgi:phage major head subunit gpT-like protein
MITRTDILAHLEYGMRSGFLKGMNAYTRLRDPFCRTVNSTRAFEVYADMGAMPWPRQNGGQPGGTATDARTGAAQVSGLHEGGPITVIGGNERAVTVYNQDWEIPIGITHNAINDGQTGNLEEWARSTGQRFEQHKDYLAFNALNAGAGTTYGNGYDRLSFFNDSHIDPGAEYQTAQDNAHALTLSLDNFETVYIAHSSFLDDRGQPAGLVPDLLIASVNLRRIGANITDNGDDYATGNRKKNPYAGDIQLLVAPGGYLDSTAWYTVVTGMAQKPINLQEREAPTLVFWDDHTQGHGIRYYKWMARYVPLYGDWSLASQGNT